MISNWKKPLVSTVDTKYFKSLRVKIIWKENGRHFGRVEGSDSSPYVGTLAIDMNLQISEYYYDFHQDNVVGQ